MRSGECAYLGTEDVGKKRFNVDRGGTEGFDDGREEMKDDTLLRRDAGRFHAIAHLR